MPINLSIVKVKQMYYEKRKKEKKNQVQKNKIFFAVGIYCSGFTFYYTIEELCELYVHHNMVFLYIDIHHIIMMNMVQS